MFQGTETILHGTIVIDTYTVRLSKPKECTTQRANRM